MFSIVFSHFLLFHELFTILDFTKKVICIIDFNQFVNFKPISLYYSLGVNIKLIEVR